MQITISTEGDETQSIVDIDLSGTQKPPFSEKNWLHKFLETQSGGEVDCQTQRVSQDKWSATCDLPYPQIGQYGELGAFSMTMTESNGHTQSKPIDVYALNAVVGVAEPLPRPVSPSAAEILVNAGGVLGILASFVGVGAMGGAAIGMAYERARNMNLHEALDILTKPATDPHFVHVKSSRDHSQIAGYEELMEQFVNGGINSFTAVLFKGKRAYCIA